LFSTVASIPLNGEYWNESLSISHDGKALLTAWLEGRASGVALMIARFSEYPNFTVTDLGAGGSRVAVTALSKGGFGVVRARRRLLEATILHDDESFSPVRLLAHETGLSIDAVPLANGALGVSTKDMLLAHVPQAGRTYIVAVTPNSWSAGVAALPNGEIVRVTSGPHEQTSNPPRYSIRGRRYAPDLSELGEFSFLLPTEVIGNILANPQQLVVLPRSNSGFVVVWTLLPHHSGSRVQFQAFDHEAHPIGPIVTVAPSDPTAHIAKASVAQAGSERLLFGWTRVRQEVSRTELVSYSPDEGSITALADTGWRPGGHAVTMTSDQTGRVWSASVQLGHLMIGSMDQG
jgi:hypothetical protein